MNCLPPEIKREVLQLLEERQALAIRQSFIEFCRHCVFEPAAHHRLLIAELEKVARGETPRLAMLMPPGSAKSTYASVLFPPWLLAGSDCNILAGFAHDRARREVGAAHPQSRIGALGYARHIFGGRQPSGGPVVAR